MELVMAASTASKYSRKLYGKSVYYCWLIVHRKLYLSKCWSWKKELHYMILESGYYSFHAWTA